MLAIRKSTREFAHYHYHRNDKYTKIFIYDKKTKQQEVDAGCVALVYIYGFGIVNIVNIWCHKFFISFH